MKKILIVDDEDDFLTLLESRLSASGYEVIKASNGKDAIQQAKIWKPGLILLDIMMPEMDGGEVRDRLKQDPDTASIPVVFLTALFTKGDEKNKGHVSGGNIYLSKSFEPEELIRVIEANIL